MSGSSNQKVGGSIPVLTILHESLGKILNPIFAPSHTETVWMCV